MLCSGLYFVEVWTNGIFQRVMEFATADDAQRYSDAVRKTHPSVNTVHYNTIRR